ncbi:zinc ABC transporter ATP-binding protein ZnuC [Varunaivibrio sulfuroxidans]|uniref:Zinc transport system ATP-binding protein n=1 Tax=Varunaivibrio sulfuroxidans TaxID=1773489 RepID=A0A4R3JDK2_9PROT|nr:zinc ABC transporter ATP-binding protein ZnuC [Varunaivibrio sulfuroxidans]TCS64098.1 zinc transport system ATP-binding protein [Varunaivibrio sulfuroxidans]WES31453.1 zinc ABC transporter ATP-binding protein ZnuC [Varunaivibrio sulfuroxidans]
MKKIGENPNHKTSLLIEADNVSVSFAGRPALNHVHCRVERGQIVTLIGPNGSGKTTLVRVLLGLQVPDSGRVFRRKGLKIGYMPQQLRLDPTLPMTVARFLALGVPRARLGDGVRRAALVEVGASHVFDSALHDISGGEMQRVMLARALLREPDVLVLDEPVQGVDINGQADLYRLIGSIRDRRGCSVVMVSHDLHMVMAETDQVICLNQHVCCAGHPEQVSRHPDFVALFGQRVAATLAVYHHQHDHRHDLQGNVLGDASAPSCATCTRGESHDHG